MVSPLCNARRSATGFFCVVHSGELRKESQIVLVETAQIGDAVLDHEQSLDPEAECETLECMRINAAVREYRRVHHAAARDFQPSIAAIRAQAHVDFKPRFHEREVSRPEAEIDVWTEERFERIGHDGLHVRE